MSGMEPVDVVYDTVFTLTHTLVETIATLTDMAGTGSYLSEQCANLAVDLENKLASVEALVLTAVEVEQLQEWFALESPDHG